MTAPSGEISNIGCMMSNRVPDDILLLVFDLVVGGPLTDWPDANYDPERAAAPFLLAAVCRRWRALTRDTATLWTYFGFPSNPATYPRHAERLRVLLAASRGTDIDVIVTLGTAYNFYAPNIAMASVHCDGILATIGQLGARWRSVRLRLPARATACLRPALQEAAPRLESLSIVSDASWFFIPPAPRLKRLYAECQYLDLPIDFEMVASFPSLEALGIISNTSVPYALTHALCQLNYQSLVEVCIMDKPIHLPAIPIQLPAVQTLVIDDMRYLPHIQASSLRCLCLNMNSSLNDLEDLRHFAHATELVLFGRIYMDDVRMMVLLDQIRTVSFHLPCAVRTCFKRNPAYNISAGTFASLNRVGHAPIWPRLQVIQFLPGDDDGMLKCDLPELLEFVRQRNVQSTLAVAPIEEIVVARMISDTDLSVISELGKLTRVTHSSI